VLAAVIYFSLRTFVAVAATTRILTTLALIWLYILIAGAPPSAIRAGVVATLVLVAGLLGRQVSSFNCTN
jgi:competence protein ComEC